MAEDETNPQHMLAFYRRMSDAGVNAEAKKFMELTPDERVELLFYMAIHTTRMMQMVHSAVDPNADVSAVPMPKTDKPN